MEERSNKVRMAPKSRRQFKPYGSALMSLAFTALGIWAVITASEWPFKAALFPLIVGIPIVVMAAIEFFLSIFETKQEDEKEDNNGFKYPEEQDNKRIWPIFLWIFGFLAIIVFVGFPAAVPLFFILYFKLKAQNTWAITLGLSAAAWLFFYGLFIRLLHVPFPEGLVQKWLNIPGTW